MNGKDEKLFWTKAMSCIRYRVCSNFFYMLRETQIPHVVVKGEPLSLYAYGAFGRRVSGDIDILTPRKNVELCKKLLQENGFESKKLDRSQEILALSASHQTSPWRKEAPCGGVDIDLNFDIFWGEYSGRRIPIEEFIKDSVELDIYGQRIRTLPPLKAMVQLILHHYKEMNSLYHLTRHDCIRRSMFRDVYCLWKNNRQDISLENLGDIVTEYEIIPYAYYVLYYTNMIYEDESLAQYVGALRTEAGEELLDCYGLSEKERKKWKVDFWTRLDTDDLNVLVRDDLTEEDREKLERNRRIFSWTEGG